MCGKPVAINYQQLQAMMVTEAETRATAVTSPARMEEVQRQKTTSIFGVRFVLCEAPMPESLQRCWPVRRPVCRRPSPSGINIGVNSRPCCHVSPEGARKYLVDPYSSHDLPQGVEPESLYLAKVGCPLVGLLGDDPFFIRSEVVLVRKLADENSEAPSTDNPLVDKHFIASKTRTCDTEKSKIK